jgi:hypothetical protein
MTVDLFEVARGQVCVSVCVCVCLYVTRLRGYMLFGIALYVCVYWGGLGYVCVPVLVCVGFNCLFGTMCMFGGGASVCHCVTVYGGGRALVREAHSCVCM